MSKLMVIGCGGCGINLAQHFINRSEPGYADIDVYMVDTSRSNLTDKIDPNKVYLFDGVDGSGKVRSTNYEPISERSKEIVQRIGNADVINIIHSGSGGSGSVISPILVSELVKKGRWVIVSVIGSTGSSIEIANTLKTLKSYAAISEQTGVPIPVTYFENSPMNPRAQIDDQVKTHVIMTSLFFSGKHRELDSADLHHFLSYDRSTNFSPAMVKLDYFDGTEINLGRDEAVVSAVTLTDENTSSDISHPIDYQAVGFLAPVVAQHTSFKMPLHAVLVLNAFNPIVSRLEAKLAEANDARSAIIHRSIVDSNATTTREGLIL